jgi:RNA polymerase sigma-70 factor (ECF subfamily)
LLNQYLQGDKGAISTLIEKHNRRVRDYIRMMVGDSDLAADIAQETFIKAVSVIDAGRYVDNGKFLSWVLRIAHNKALDYFRSQKSNSSVSESSAGYNVLGTIKYAEKSIEENMISEQIDTDIRSLVSELPEEQREVVMLRYYSDLSFKEIADQTGVSINTALGRMRYALINLRKMIKERNLTLC